MLTYVANVICLGMLLLFCLKMVFEDHHFAITKTLQVNIKVFISRYNISHRTDDTPS